MYVSPSQISSFQEMIFSWWEKNKRDLPWRHTHNPYKILVSEVMLQQTQVSRVLPKYKEFIRRFPAVDSLAKAKKSEVLTIWKGLGYNRRALYLKETAGYVVREHNGRFPTDMSLLLKLPGIGTYTAGAIMVFAFKHDMAIVDTNIRQIISKFFVNREKSTVKSISQIALQLLPKGKSWEWHQALMDYGALALIRTPPGIPKKDTVPFRQTNRFFRGRVIDLLREKEMKKQFLIKTISKKFEKNKEFIGTILEGLQHDGLIEILKTNVVRLPE